MYIAEMALLGAAIGTALGWIAIAVASGPPRQHLPQVERRIGGPGSEVRVEIAQVRNELRGEIAELRSEMRAGFAELRAQ